MASSLKVRGFSSYVHIVRFRRQTNPVTCLKEIGYVFFRYLTYANMQVFVFSFLMKILVFSLLDCIDNGYFSGGQFLQVGKYGSSLIC